MYDIREDPNCLFHKLIDDGEVEITVMRMIFNTRICIGPTGAGYYDDGWCYPDQQTAIEAAKAWDGEGDPPEGWIKQVSTGRRRKDGDPDQEYVER